MSCPVTTEVASSNTTSIPRTNSALMTTIQTISVPSPVQQTVSTTANVVTATAQTVSSASSYGQQTALNVSTFVTATTQIVSTAAAPGQQTTGTNLTAIAHIMSPTSSSGQQTVSRSATGGNTTIQTVSPASSSGQQTVSTSATAGTTTLQIVSPASSSGQQTVSTSATGGTTTIQTVSPASSSGQQTVSTSATGGTTTIQTVSHASLFGQQTVSTSTASGTTTTQTVSSGSSSGQQTVPPATPSVTAATQTAMASRIDVTPEETHFLRFISLVLKIGPRAVRHLFDLHNDPSHLDKIISDNKHKLENLLNNKIINKDHWSVLFPGNRHASSEKFDLTLMIAFLRDITGLKAPKSGWYRLPDTNDRSVEAALVRIKYYRNKVAHAVSCSVNKHDFSLSWTDLSEAIIRLGGEKFKLETLALLETPLDASYQDLYREFKAMKEHIIPSNIQFLMNVKVQGMAMEDKTFISTRATNSVKDAVDQYSVVIVTGPPGSGKTATVNHIALQLQEQGYRICPVVSTKEIIECWMPESPQVFVFNDPFGIHAINQSELYHWTNQQERLGTCFHYSNMKILATIRSHIIEDEQISQNILSSSDLQTISLVNDEIVLTDDERLKIFNAHAKFKKRDDLKAMGVEIQNFSISCFPLLCRIYTSDEESKFSVKDFFQKPLSVIRKDLDKFKINDPIRYFCLLYCMINDNNLDTDLLSINVESKTIETSRTVLLEKCKISTSLSMEEIKSKIDTLLNTYLKLEGKSYHFIHDIIHDAVIRHVNGLPSDWKRIILQHCGPKFLNERIRFNASEYRQNEDGYLLLNSDLESVWSERILQDMIGDHMNWNHMVNNTTLSTEKGDMLLLKSFKCMDLTELQRFILLSHPCKAFSPILEASKKLKTIDYMDLDLNVVAILHLIICLGLKKCLKHILKTTLPITFKHIKVNLLLVACIMGQTDIVEMLLLNGYSANLFAPSGHSVLFLSSFFGHVEVVTILLKHKANKNLCDMDGRSPLFEASYKGHVEVVKVLLEHKADKDKCDKDGQSPLFMSSMYDHVEVVKVLLEHKADKDKCDWYGRSPLFIASDHGHVEVVKVLLEHKAKMYQRDKDGLSPLLISSMRGRVEVVEVLLKHKAGKGDCDNYGQSPLFISSMFGHVEAVKVLLKHKADIDQCDWYGQSPLFIASMRGRVEVVKVLLEHKAKIDQCNMYGRSPLFIASYHGHVEVVEVLLEHKAKIYQCDKNGQSPLFISSMRGRVEVVEVLLKHKADIDQCDKYDRSPLYMSSMIGRVEVVKLLLKHKAGIDQCNKDGQSPLHIASDHGHGEVVEVLLEHKAKIDQWDKDGQSPLLISSMRGRVEVVKLLLKHKADIDQCNKYDQSPLYMSSMYGHVEVVKVLLEHKAKIDQCDKDGQSPLLISSMRGRVKVVEVLLKHKANKDQWDKDGQSPLFIASDYDHVEVVKVLLEYKADKDKCDKHDRSPLFIASDHGHVEVVKVLLEYKADKDQCDKYGQSPLFISSLFGHVEVVKVLLKHKADIDQCDKYGQSPLFISSMRGRVEVVKVLLKHKADKDQLDKDGRSPLLIASYQGHVEVVKVLLELKADKDQCDRYGQSPLFLASNYCHVEVVKVLLKHKIDKDQCDTHGQSPLFISSMFGHVEVVKVLLEYKAELDLCDKKGQSPLFMSSMFGHVEVVKVLLEHKAKLDLCDKKGQSLLHIASSHGHVEVVKVLLKHTAEFDLSDARGQSPLHIASSHGHVEVVKVLLKHEAELDLCDKEGQSPLHIASSHGHVEVVKVLLEQKTKLDLCDKEGQSPLHIASSDGHVEVVKVLLKHKAELDLCDKEGRSPLHIASSHGHVEVVKMLLEHKAKLDLCDNEGPLPLHVASSHGHVEVVRVLWEYKSKLDLCDKEGQSPLHIASSYGHVEVVKMLLEHKAKLDLCDNEGRSPLHVASSHGYVDVVKVLVEHKAKLDLCNNEGQSPLHVASSHGHVEVVKVLLEHKAQLDLCDKEGQSPLYISSSHGHVEVAKVLLEHKAKLDLCDTKGQSPLHIASSHGHVELVKVLLEHKAKLDLFDTKGQSLLHIASSHGHVELVKVFFEHGTSFICRYSIYDPPLLLDLSMRGHAEAVNLLLEYKANKGQRDKYGKRKIISPVKSNSDHSNLKVLRCRSPIEYLDCEDFNIKRSKEYFQFCKTFCGTQLYTQRELHRRLKHALNILDAEQEEENDVTLDNTLLSLSKCGKSSYGHLLLAYNMIQLGANTKSADKYGNSNIHFAVQNSNVFLTILLLQNRDSVVMKNTIVDVLKYVIDLHKKNCQHGNIWDKNTECEHVVIARYISYLIAFHYQRKLSDYYKYLKVWPGYKHQDEISSYQGLHFVIQYDKIREGHITTVSITSDIPVIWHNVCIVSTEGKYMNFKTQEHENDEDLIRKFNNFRSIDKQTAKMLFKCHRNLNIISVSMLKSVGYGKNHEIIKKPCVTLYCDVKGIIPVGEEDFNSSLPGHDLDIREGHFSFVAGGGSHEYHGQLKMGCAIGTPETFPNYGTLGGFVEHERKMYLLTCAHVVFSIQELQRQMSPNMYGRKVVQPQDENQNKIGQVRRFRFPKTTDDSETSVDAALVEISSRMPVDGTFPDDDLKNLYKAGYIDLPTFRSGEIKASIERADRRNQVVKFGAKTGLTIGNFNPHKDHVRIRNDDWWITEFRKQRWLTHHIQIFNQYEIAPLGNSTFADEGDSGSFVFMMKNNDENRLQCIGMVIGLTSAGTVLVTPISSILESLFLNADSLKTFDSSAIVEKEHANHDPLIPNNVNDALDEGKKRVERRILLFIVSFGVFILAVLFSVISK